MVSTNLSWSSVAEQTLDLHGIRHQHADLGRVPFTVVDTFEGVVSDPVTLHKYLYGNGNPVGNTDPTGNLSLPQITVGISLTVLLGSIIGASIGAISGAAVGAYLHIVQYRTYDGIWDSVSAGAAYGAIQGAIIGAAAGSGNPVLLASALSATLGYNVSQSIPMYFDQTVNNETKVAITFLLLLQGKGTVASIKTTFSKSNISPQMYVSEALKYSKLGKDVLLTKAGPPNAGLLGDVFGIGNKGALARLSLARQGKLQIPPGLTRDALLAYREVALRQIAEFGPDKVPVQVNRVMIIEEILPQVK